MVNLLKNFRSNGKVEKEKLSRPEEIPGLVIKYLCATFQKSPESLDFLECVRQKSNGEEKQYDIRIFDPLEAMDKKIKVEDYSTLESNRDLIIYEGTYNEKTKQVNMSMLRVPNASVSILSEQEIRSQIESLKQGGDSVFFYLASSPANGGPLGRGAAIVELQPEVPGKKKRYFIYTADVAEKQPVDMGSKLWDSDKPGDIARWIKERHNRPDR